MSKEHLLNLLCRVYVQEISADEAFDELEDLIDRIKRLEEAGDVLSHYLREMPYAISDYLAQLDERSLRINNWREAKEDKL